MSTLADEAAGASAEGLATADADQGDSVPIEGTVEEQQGKRQQGERVGCTGGWNGGWAAAWAQPQRQI